MSVKMIILKDLYDGLHFRPVFKQGQTFEYFRDESHFFINDYIFQTELLSRLILYGYVDQYREERDNKEVPK